VSTVSMMYVELLVQYLGSAHLSNWNGMVIEDVLCCNAILVWGQAV